jgi:octaprenyl-diphosphate synthase
MAACMKIGGVKGRMSAEEREVLYETGLNLGYAFQIVDDTLDVIDDPRRTGKMSGNDFFEGKITLPFLNLLENVNGSEREKLAGYAKNPDAEKWEIVQKNIREKGCVEYCLSIADDYNMKVDASLARLPASAFRDIIFELSKFLVERKY